LGQIKYFASISKLLRLEQAEASFFAGLIERVELKIQILGIRNNSSSTLQLFWQAFEEQLGNHEV
jgi:hypothetical protein